MTEPSPSSYIVRLTDSDRKAIQTIFEAKKAVKYGERPTVDSLKQQGLLGISRLDEIVAAIRSGGEVVIQVIGELIKAFAAPLLAIALTALEANRIQAGVIALGQHEEQALLIAIAFTVINAVLPIYRLRNVEGQAHLTRSRWTLKGLGEDIKYRLSGIPETYEVNIHHNPSLMVAELTFTLATLFLAFYAVLAPQLTAYSNLTWYDALITIFSTGRITDILGLGAGVLMSIGGVYGVKSIAHEIGVRTVTFQVKDPVVIVREAQERYDQNAVVLQEEIEKEYAAQKAAELERRKADKAAAERVEASPLPLSSNGVNGQHHH